MTEAPASPSEPPGPAAPPGIHSPARGLTLGAQLLRLWPYALITFLYLATSPYHQGLNNPNEMVRVYMTKAWVEEGTFAIDGVVRRWGGVDDKALRDGQLYSSKAPLQSLLGIPIWRFAEPLLERLGVTPNKRTLTWVLRIFGSALFGIAFASLLLAWARRRAVELGASEDLGTAVGLTLALGTMLYPYALTFTGHLLAAFAAGGCYLAVLLLARAPLGSRRWMGLAVLAGFAAAAAPFAEYPAALVAGPALLAALAITPGWIRRAELVALLAIGGALPFALGLWSHAELWGSPLATGYSFLENRSYVEVHGEGFFGVSTPKAEALGGALFSPGTGLFFYSPILLIGLAALIHRILRSQGEPPGFLARVFAPTVVPRALAVAGLVGLLAEIWFISSHKGWRGGWTVGPRYIIPVAPLLGLWVIEALAVPKLRSWIAALGALSILLTGFAAALYPHLSDVFTNPLWTFLVPSYLHGEMTYGLGHSLGLSGGAANLIHVVPLLFAMAYVAMAGVASEEPWLSRLFGRHVTYRRVAILLVTFGVAIATVALIPERDAAAARRENQRLWGFWEPARPGDGPKGARRHTRKGLLHSARQRHRQVTVEAIAADGTLRPCSPFAGGRCSYGDQPWHRFNPEEMDFDGLREPVLFLHPIAGSTVRATVPVPKAAATAVLRYGLADASVASPNPHPVVVRLRQGERELGRVEAGRRRGLQSLELALTSTAPLAVEITAVEDGARVFGFDLELYR